MLYYVALKMKVFQIFHDDVNAIRIYFHIFPSGRHLCTFSKKLWKKYLIPSAILVSNASLRERITDRSCMKYYDVVMYVYMYAWQYVAIYYILYHFIIIVNIIRNIIYYYLIISILRKCM